MQGLLSMVTVPHSTGRKFSQTSAKKETRSCTKAYQKHLEVSLPFHMVLDDVPRLLLNGHPVSPTLHHIIIGFKRLARD